MVYGIAKVLVLSTVGLVVFPLIARAQDESVLRERGGFQSQRMAEALQLNEIQTSTITELFASNRENLRPLREQLREQRELLRQAITTQPFDESQVRLQAQEIAKLQAELLVARAALMHQIASMLTEEQKAKLADLREQRRERFKAWRERRGGHPGPQEG